jgi:hypothetical protein
MLLSVMATTDAAKAALDTHQVVNRLNTTMLYQLSQKNRLAGKLLLTMFLPIINSGTNPIKSKNVVGIIGKPAASNKPLRVAQAIPKTRGLSDHKTATRHHDKTIHTPVNNNSGHQPHKGRLLICQPAAAIQAKPHAAGNHFCAVFKGVIVVVDSKI